MAELIVKEIKTPKVEWNYEDIKTAVMQKVEEFTGLVYTDDTIGDAKKDRAELNRLKKELNDRRISLEREYMAPFKEFKGQVDELIKLIDKPVAMIDAEVKDYEERRKKQKQTEIIGLYAEIFSEDIPFDMIEDQKWYNVSTSMASIREEMEQKNESIKYDLQTIKTLKHPEIAEECYRKTFDIRKAIEKSNEYEHYMAIQNAPKEAHGTEAKPEPKVEEETFEVTFACTLTKSQARKLKEFFDMNGIMYRKVER